MSFAVRIILQADNHVIDVVFVVSEEKQLEHGSVSFTSEGAFFDSLSYTSAQILEVSEISATELFIRLAPPLEIVIKALICKYGSNSY